MKNRKNVIIGVLSCAMLLLIGCKKDFLDEKPATDLNVPTTLNDLQLLLDNDAVLNRSPALGEYSADDYYMTDDIWKNQPVLQYSNEYIWAKDIFSGVGNITDWNSPYTQVLYANIVLKQLEKINRDAANGQYYDNIKGSALFLRAWAFFDLAQVFAMPYDMVTANSDLGIPLRLTPDINETSTRSTIKGTYDQILSDAMLAKKLLTSKTSTLNGNRPSKAAAYAFLSRMYLTMRDYSQSGLYADSALMLNSSLIDYNTLSTTSTTPFSIINAETIYRNALVSSNKTIFLRTSEGYSIDSLLYQSYETNDLRKDVYFSVNGKYINKKRGYLGGSGIANGLITDELYLNRAECYARAGKLDEALNDLNTLLTTRWKSGTYIPYSSTSVQDVLAKILSERRKELVMRGLRWNDIRRLNKEGYNLVLKRNLNGQVYTLPPNDPRYALPIPPDVISLSGIPQNKR